MVLVFKVSFTCARSKKGDFNHNWQAVRIKVGECGVMACSGRIQATYIIPPFSSLSASLHFCLGKPSILNTNSFTLESEVDFLV